MLFEAITALEPNIHLGTPPWGCQGWGFNRRRVDFGLLGSPIPQTATEPISIPLYNNEEYSTSNF